MPQVCIIALMGLPAAGKTTFCQQILKMHGLQFNVAHFCFDDFSPLNLHKQTDFNYKKERSKILSLLQILVETIKQEKSVRENIMLNNIKVSHLNAQNYVILFDDNNYYTSMRYEIYQICKANQLSFGQIYFPIAASHALLRNAKRDKISQVPTYIIEKMADRLELPNMHHYNWEVNTLHLDLNENRCYKATFVKFITKCLEHSVEAQPSIEDNATKSLTVSNSHYLDVQLRRRIKIILDTEPLKDVKKQKAALLNSKRKEILSTFNKSMENKLVFFEKLDDLCNLLE